MSSSKVIVKKRSQKRVATVKPYKSPSSDSRYICYYPSVEGRKRAYFKTKKEADLFKYKKNAQYDRVGNDAKSLTDDLLKQASEASKLLKPYQCSLIDAVKFYCQYQESKATSISIDEAIPLYYDDKESQGVSKRYLEDIKSRSKKIVQEFSGMHLSHIESIHVNSWVKRLGLAPQTKIHYRNLLHNIFAWAVELHYCSENPVTNVAKIKIKPSDIEIFTINEIAKILNYSDGDVRAFIALGAFAGLRSSEIQRLSWRDVNLIEKHITLKASKTKTAQRRLVYLEDNIIEWIRPLYIEGQPVCQKGFERRLKKFKTNLMEKEGIQWLHNALRHSYASYYMAMTNDAPKTSLMLGHEDNKVVFRNYREIVTEKEGRSWFNINPKSNNDDTVLRFAS